MFRGFSIICSLWLMTMLSLSPLKLEASGLPIVQGVGGPFSINSTLGKKVGLSDFQGKLVMLYFGYSNCPDVCPLTTAHIAAVLKQLGEKAAEVQVLFLTVDPDYDTPEVLRKYLSYFDERIIGLTGTRVEVDQVLDLYKAEYSQVTNLPLPLDIKVTQRTGLTTGYIYSHTARIYLIDKKGQTRAFYYLGTPVQQMKEGILSLLDTKPGVEIHHPWVRAMPPTSRVTAVYGTFRNLTDQEERLLAIESPIAEQGELHQTQMKNEMAHMVPLSHLAIPPQSELVLQPGAYHGMLMGLKTEAPQESQEVEVTFIFEKAGRQTVQAKVLKGHTSGGHPTHRSQIHASGSMNPSTH